MESVIVIGAGAAGLMAAYELSKKQKQVFILEASNRIGGRIYTFNDASFSMPVELGAEFIHGDLPITTQLLKEAGVSFYETSGKMLRIEKGKFIKRNEPGAHWSACMKQMAALKNDMPLGKFLLTFFSGDAYKDLRRSVQQFAEGFDLADPADASTTALYSEWENEMGSQYRVDGGYGQLTDHLATMCKKNGCVIKLNCCVKKISWTKDEVNIITMCSQYFTCNKLIIAVPLSVLQAGENDLSYIEFTPLIGDYLDAANQVGFGTVIKILLQFDESFWNHEKKNAGFIFTGGPVPTWWTQLPKDTALLTGWLGGPNAEILRHTDDETILEMGLQSLASAFAKPVDALQKKLLAHKITNWSAMPHIGGGYSYYKLKSREAKKILNTPIEQTIFFAGEGIHEGSSAGTVEAALMSGREAALKISG